MIRSFRTTVILAALCGIVLAASCAKTKSGHKDPEAEVAAATLTRVGDPAPDFTVQELDGTTVTLSALRGKVVLVNWWATWCPPCVDEMPLLQSLVWDRFQGENFAMIAVSRAEKTEVVATWIKDQGFTFPVAIDPDRTSYSKYATAYIPRSYVIGPDGVILFQSQGYEKPEFAAMIETIATALGGGI